MTYAQLAQHILKITAYLMCRHIFTGAYCALVGREELVVIVFHFKELFLGARVLHMIIRTGQPQEASPHIV